MSVQGNLTKLAATGKELFQEPLGTFGFELLKYVCVRECEMGRFEKFSWVLFLVILFELGRFDKSGGRRWRDGICLLPDLSYPHFNLDLRAICLLFTFHPPSPCGRCINIQLYNWSSNFQNISELSILNVCE